MNRTGDTGRVRLRVAFRNLFYTTIYTAVEGGFLADAGLDIDFAHIPTGQASTELLKAGEIDLTQSGISRSLMDLDTGSDDPPQHVAEINRRDGFFLLSRQPRDDWQWSDLNGATLIPVGFTPVPYMTLKDAMRRHDVNPADVRLLDGLPAEEMLARFRSGDADYLQVPCPFTEQLIQEGTGHLVATLGAESGYICYSSIAATPEYIASNPETIQRFVNGYYRAQQWVHESAPDAIAEQIAPIFPDYTPQILTASIARYKDAGVWAVNPMIGQDGYDRMRDILIAGGLVQNSHPYHRIVRPEFAQRAMS